MTPRLTFLDVDGRLIALSGNVTELTGTAPHAHPARACAVTRFQVVFLAMQGCHGAYL